MSLAGYNSNPLFIRSNEKNNVFLIILFDWYLYCIQALIETLSDNKGLSIYVTSVRFFTTTGSRHLVCPRCEAWDWSISTNRMPHIEVKLNGEITLSSRNAEVVPLCWAWLSCSPSGWCLYVTILGWQSASGLYCIPARNQRRRSWTKSQQTKNSRQFSRTTSEIMVGIHWL